MATLALTTILDCGHPPSACESFTTGYGIDSDGRKSCYACCAVGDVNLMRETGRNTLYLTHHDDGLGCAMVQRRHSSQRVCALARHWTVSNWTGSLRYAVTSISHSASNWWNVYRADVRFVGPDGCAWYGRQQGDNDLVRVKRVKKG
jgi:hypothetical protein